MDKGRRFEFSLRYDSIFWRPLTNFQSDGRSWYRKAGFKRKRIRVTSMKQ
jgi:hypothetical protein